jgi:hypothetical protein
MLLNQRFGGLARKYFRRPDWYFIEETKVEIFITDSKAHHDQRPWFDMQESDIKELAENPAAFVIFILGEADSFLVIPAKRLEEELKNYDGGSRVLETGYYHFNLKFKPTFEQLPEFDLSSFKGNLELIQKATRQ